MAWCFRALFARDAGQGGCIVKDVRRLGAAATAALVSFVPFFLSTLAVTAHAATGGDGPPSPALVTLPGHVPAVLSRATAIAATALQAKTSVASPLALTIVL